MFMTLGTNLYILVYALFQIMYHEKKILKTNVIPKNHKKHKQTIASQGVCKTYQFPKTGPHELKRTR